MGIPPHILACLFWLFSAFCWVIGFLYPNEHSVSFPVTGIWRGTAMIITNYIFVRSKNMNINIMDDNQHYYSLLRNLCILGSSTIFTQAQFYLPLPFVHTINNLAPLIVLLLDDLVNGIKFTKIQGLGALTGFLGIVILINTVEQPQVDSIHNYVAKNQTEVILAAILLLFSVFLFSFSILLTKKLHHMSPHQIGLQTGFALLFGNSLIYPYYQEQLFGYSFNYTIFLKGFFYSGFIFSIGCIAELYALKLWNKSGLLTLMEFVTVFIAYCISIFRYHETVSLGNLLGALLILLGVYKAVISENSQEKRQQSAYRSSISQEF